MTAVNTFASQCLGRGRPSDAAAYAWQGVILGLFFGLLCLPGVFAVPWLTGQLGHAPAVREQENAYVRWAMLSAGPTMVSYALTQFFVGVHRPWLGCVATVAANAFNVLANWLLIFGHAGCPRMGISGAALGTVLATVVQCGILLWFYWSAQFRRTYATHRQIGWCRRKAAGVLRVGMPVGAQFGMDILSWTVFVAVVVGRLFGTAHLAASNIVFQYLHLSFMPAVGIGVALCAMTGKAIGRGDIELAKRQTYHATAVCMAYMGLCGVVFFFARTPLVKLFNSDPVVISIGAQLFVLAAVFQVFDGLGIAAMNALRGAGDTFWPSTYVAVLTWMVLIGGGLAAGVAWPEAGSVGPWLMATAYIILVGMALWVRFLRGHWRKMDIFGPASGTALLAGGPSEAADGAPPALVLKE